MDICRVCSLPSFCILLVILISYYFFFLSLSSAILLAALHHHYYQYVKVQMFTPSFCIFFLYAVISCEEKKISYLYFQKAKTLISQIYSD
ncbi:hypothetical protein PUN28_004350 [Cardiocondyla obscurior]|uniref:Uncharacterized protein n=1 Tax=Cardiocondyla obscurior TaxID=286306 RepID=A0AAW2GGG4_9HYME